MDAMRNRWGAYALCCALITSCQPDTTDDKSSDAATCAKDSGADCGVEAGALPLNGTSARGTSSAAGASGEGGEQGLAGTAGMDAQGGAEANDIKLPPIATPEEPATTLKALYGAKLLSFDCSNCGRTFARASTATFQGVASGAITVSTAAAGTLRSEQRLTDPSDAPTLWLFEGARTNYVKGNSDFGNTTRWGQYFLAPAAVVTNVASPDGATGAATVHYGQGTGGSCIRQSILNNYTATIQENVAVSVYRHDGRFRFRTDIGAPGDTYFSPSYPALIDMSSDAWGRLEQVVPANDQKPNVLRFCVSIPAYLDDQDSPVTLWGAQVETGDFPSSLIHTTATVATRAADELSFDASPALMQNGRYRFEVYPLHGAEDAYRPSTNALGIADATFGLFSFGSAASSISLYYDAQGRTFVRIAQPGLGQGGQGHFDIAHRWQRHDRISITIDIPNDRIAINGTWTTVTGLGNFATGTLRIGALHDGVGAMDPSTNAFARISEPHEYAKACPNGNECGSGYTCGTNNGWRFGPDLESNVCWPTQECVTESASDNCGSISAACGLCCTEDSHCGSGNECGIKVGRRVGLEADANICWDEGCSHTPQAAPSPTLECGAIDSTCGLCPTLGGEPFLAYADGDFTRASVATGMDYDATQSIVVHDYEIDELRTERRVSDGLAVPTLYLLEGSREIVVRQSARLDQYGGSLNLPTTPASSGFANVATPTAPDGSQESVAIYLPNHSNNAYYYKSVTVGALQNVALSLFQHSGAGRLMGRDHTPVLHSGADFPTGSLWRRFDMNMPSGTGTATAVLRIANVAGVTSTSTVVAWGAQAEVASFPSSFFRTANADDGPTNIRAADSLDMAEAPASMTNAPEAWAVDIYPLHGSSDGESASNPLGISDTTFGLFAFGGTGANATTDQYIALYYDADGVSHLRVKQGATTTDIPVEWERHQKMTLTVDVTNDRIGFGDVSRAISLSNFPAGRLRVGGLYSGTDTAQADGTSAFARMSEPRSAALTACDEDTDCRQGEVCGEDNGDNYGNASARVCWSAACETDFAGRCGSVNSECGVCCSSSADCAAGEACGINAGARKGLGEGVNLCWPAECSVYDPRRVTDCGTTSDPCGLCPVCIPDCDGKDCGDNGCGGSCGSVPNETTHYCSPEGLILESKGNFNRPIGSAKPPADPTMGDLPFLAQASTSEAGTLTGAFSVTDTGAASYAIPIEVPPGRAGFAPNLALRYASTRANGAVGAGWSLEGFSAITRCRRSRLAGGTNTTIKYDDTDAFCLDGAMLVPITSWAANGLSETEYRTEFESFRKIISYGRSQHGPRYFRVWSKDGVVTTYGENENASLRFVEGGNKGVKRVWAVSSMDDARGNYISVVYGGVQASGDTHFFALTAHYEGDEPTIELLPVSVFYGGVRTSPGGEALAGQRSDRVVHLRYDTDRNLETREPLRNDTMFGFVDGQPAAKAQLLTAIETRVEGRVITSYELEYEEDSRGVSVLQEVKRCAPVQPTFAGPDENPRSNPEGWTCLSPVELQYHSTDTPVFLPAMPMAPLRGGAYSEAWDNGGVFVGADVDGDGRDEIVGGYRRSSGSADLRVQYYDPSFSELQVVDAGISLPAEAVKYAALFAEDWDGDGDDDILVGYGGGWDVYTSQGLTSPVFSYSTGFGQSFANWNEYGLFHHFLADVNHDGVRDLVECVDGGNGRAYVRTTLNPSEVSPEIAFDCGGEDGASVDLDDDGTTDLDLLPSGTFNVDLTGDGVDDSLFVGGNYTDAHSEWGFHPNFGVSIGRGDGTFDSTYYAGTCVTEPSDGVHVTSGIYTYKQEIYGLNPAKTMLLFDYDGDFRTDIVVPPSLAPSKPWTVMHWPTPGVSPRVSATVTTDDVLGHGRGNTHAATDGVPTILADVNGDGMGDIVNPRRNDVYLRHPARVQAGLLHRVLTPGHGYTVSYSYEAHTPDMGCEYPAQCLRRAPHAVVSSVNESRGLNSLSVDYEYVGARSDRVRGSYLGFRERTVSVSDGGTTPSRTTIEAYGSDLYSEAQQFFYGAGRLVGRETTIPIEHVGEIETTLGERREVETFGHTLKTSASGHPYVIQSFSESRTYETQDLLLEPTGAQVSARIEGFIDTDSYGNPLGGAAAEVNAFDQVVATTTTTREYWPPSETNWLISRLKTETTTDEYMGHSETRTLDFEYTPGGGSARDGLVWKVVRAKDDAQYATTIEYTRDALGNVIAVTTSAGNESRVVEWSYDSQGMFPERMTRTVAGVDMVTQIRLSAAHGGILSAVAPNGTATLWSYDAFGRERRVHDLDRSWQPSRGSETIYGVLPGTPEISEPLPVAPVASISIRNGQVGSDESVDATLGERAMGLDGVGRIVSEMSTGFEGQIIKSERLHDAWGRVVAESLPHAPGFLERGYVLYTHDNLGRPILSVDPLNRVTRYEYGTVHGLINPPSDGAWTTKIVDAEGKASALLLSLRGYPLWSVNDVGKTSYEYQAFGNLTKVADSQQHERTLTWGDYSTLENVDDPDSGVVAYQYYPLGLLHLTTNARLGTVEYVYDAIGRVISTVEKPEVSDPSKDKTTTWVWDDGDHQNIGKLVSVSRVGGGTTTTQTQTYTQTLGLPQTSTLSLVSPSLTTSASTRVDYDGFGRPLIVTYPTSGQECVGCANDFAVSFEYDPQHGHLRSVRADHDPTSDPFWEWTEAEHGYLIKAQVFGNGTTTSFDYFKTGEIERIQTMGTGSVTLQDLSYTYYDNGNVETVTNAFGIDSEYEYDGLNRLTHVRHDDRLVERFEYDAIGNITSREAYQYDALGEATINTTSYDYTPHPTGDATGIPHAVRSVGINEYRYDAVGNQVTRTGPDIIGGTQQITYNMLGLPDRIVSGSVLTPSAVAYAYDAHGARVARSDDAGSTFYLGDLYQRHVPEDPAQPIEHRYGVMVFGSKIAEVVRLEEQDTPGTVVETGTTYFHENHLGSPETVSDELGQSSHLVFGAYGAPEGDYWQDGSTRGFTGHMHEPDLGLINMRGRFYDPFIGRFITPDPVASSVDSEGLNRFSYVRNNPSNWIDPSGLDPVPYCDCVGQFGCTCGGNGGGGGDGNEEEPQGGIWQDCSEFGQGYTWNTEVRDCVPPPAPNRLVYQHGQTTDHGVYCTCILGCTADGTCYVPPPPTTSSQSERVQPTVVHARQPTYDTFNGSRSTEAASASSQGGQALVDTDRLYQISVGDVVSDVAPILASLIPGVGFFQDFSVVADSRNPTWVRALATASMALDVLTLSASPNVGSVAHSWCFAEGTLVHTEDGLRPIEEIQAGDLVWARNGSTGEVELREVVRTFVTPDRPVFQLVLTHADESAQEIRVTGEHPFYTRARGWVGTRDLAIDDEIVLISGEILSVTAVARLAESTTVYNFEVEGTHTYFVGERGAWVHNQCAMGAARAVEATTLGRLAARLPGRTLRESTDVAVDYVDDLGRTYDQMGNPGMIPHWDTQKANFLKQIDLHLGKADFTVIDLTGFPQSIRNDVTNYILNLSDSQFDRIVPIGF